VEAHFAGLLNAAADGVCTIAARGGWNTPFIYRWQLFDQLEHRYENTA